MKIIYLIILVALSTLLISSCRRKEVFPDLAKQMEGHYLASQVQLVYYVPTYRRTGEYNPKDSSQVGEVIIRKIDALSVHVDLSLKKQTGQILFEDNFDCELSRDINNKGWIKFYRAGGQAGSFIVDDGSVGYNYLSLGSLTQKGNQVSNVTGSFLVKV